MVWFHFHYKKNKFLPHRLFAESVCVHTVALFVFLQSGLDVLTPLCCEETSEQKTWKTFIISLAPLRLNVLEIIYWAFKLPCELLKQSVAMEAIFKNTHMGGGGGAPRGKRWCREGESKPNLMLLLIYLILTAQRFKRNMEWKPLRSVHLFIHPSPSLPLYVFKARIDSKKIQQLMDLCTVQHSAEQALTF